MARRYLEPLAAAWIDTLVLGCTPSPLLRPVLERVLGPGVALVDSAAAVAEAAARDLAAAGLLATDTAPPEHHFYVTDSGERFARIARQILGDPVAFELVEVH